MTNVNLTKLQQAFALATRAAAREDTPQRERNEFRAIAYMIWTALGNTTHLPGRKEAEEQSADDR